MQNLRGTRGICFNVYDGGLQFIFPNGEYCGFSTEEIKEFFKEGDDFSFKHSSYQFKNIMQVTEDYNKGFFKLE